jgi:hypothetical protein
MPPGGFGGPGFGGRFGGPGRAPGRQPERQGPEGPAPERPRRPDF